MSNFTLGSYVAWALDQQYKGIIIDIVNNYEYDPDGDVIVETCYRIRWNNHVTKEFCDKNDLILLSEGKNDQ